MATRPAGSYRGPITLGPSSFSNTGRRLRNKNLPDILPFPDLKTDTAESDPIFTPLSPPPSPFSPRSPPRSPRRKKFPDPFTRRLRGKLGLKLHVDESALRRYTDYDYHGTPRANFLSPGIWAGNTSSAEGGDDARTTSLDQYRDAPAPPLPVLDVFAMKTVDAIIKDAAAASRLHHFAQSRGRARDVDFLLKVEEYLQAINMVSSVMSSMAIKFTGPAASAPIRLPQAVSRSLNTDMRSISSSLLPGLEGLFDDAKAHVGWSLAHDIYPDFLNHQLALSLQAVGPGYAPNQVCPGFGEAFCMTDCRAADDPMVFVSDGLACLTGHTMDELVAHNCRIFQGPATGASCVDRVRDALATEDEWSELVLNYRKDGRIFWNLLFTARLVGADGQPRYHLGGQIDVSEMIERQEDVLALLSHTSPLGERKARAAAAVAPTTPPCHIGPDENQPPPPQQQQQQQQCQQTDRRLSWRGGLRERRHERERDTRYPPLSSRTRLLRTFRRRPSPSGDASTSASASSPRPSSSSNTSASDPSTPLTERMGALTLCVSDAAPCAHHAVLSPYSRFLVLEYDQAGAGPPETGAEAQAGHHKQKTPWRAQLPVAFCAAAAADSLSGSGQRDAADVVGRGVFDVLAEMGGSPSISKSFKTTVRASLGEGRALRLDLTLNGAGPRRVRGLSLSRKHSSVSLSGLRSRNNDGSATAAAAATGHHGRSLRKSLSLEKIVGGGLGYAPSENYVSYWTPLKDARGDVKYVVVIMVPEVY